MKIASMKGCRCLKGSLDYLSRLLLGSKRAPSAGTCSQMLIHGEMTLERKEKKDESE